MKNFLFAVLGMIAGIGIGIAFAADRCANQESSLPEQTAMANVRCAGDGFTLAQQNPFTGEIVVDCGQLTNQSFTVDTINPNVARTIPPLVTFSSRTPGRDVGGFAFWLYLLYYIYIHFMLDFIKRLVIFAIGFYIVIFIAKNTLGGLSFTKTARDIAGAFAEIRKIGQGSGNYGSNTRATSTLSKFVKTSKGSESAVSFINLSRGEMVDTKSTVLGNIDTKWLYDNVGTARFLNEVGDILGTAPVVGEGVPDTNGKLPFSILPQFNQGTAKTGYIVIEKVNNTGLSKNDAWFTLPITYPVTNQQQGSQYNQYNTGQQLNSVQSTGTVQQVGGFIPNGPRDGFQAPNSAIGR